MQMAYDVPIGNATGHISDLPFKQQMKLQFTDMGKRAWSSAKNFGYIGMIYAGVECGVESASILYFLIHFKALH
jgi:import inner membrane translocase subunit TIM22